MADVVVRKRVANLSQEIKEGGFEPVSPTHLPAQMRSEKMIADLQGRPGIPGYSVKFLVDDPNSTHLIEIVNIEAGSNKFRHKHQPQETVIVILEGEGEFCIDEEKSISVKAGDFCHALPGEIHGVINTGSTPLRYLVVEGPLPAEPGLSPR